MKIGIDAGCLGVNDERLKVGVYHFASNVLLHLSKIDNKNEYILYSFNPIDSELLKKLGPNMKNTIVRPIKGWLKIWLPIKMIRDQVDVFLAFGQAVPPRMSPNIKVIGVVYDLAFEKFKNEYQDSYSVIHENTKNLVKKSSHIIAISEKVKKDIQAEYKDLKTEISVIPLGVRQHTKKKNNIFQQKNKYFLYVGSLKKIKNIPTLLQAFETFSHSTKNEIELVLVGGDRWKDPEIDKVLNTMSDETLEKISFRGHISDADVFLLYKNAIAFVSPSLYEGFGLPFLEAMSEGCPVIGSNAGAIPEVVGSAGILVPPTDVKALAKAMIDVYKESELRSKLVKRGLTQSLKYTWEKSAEKLLHTLQSL